MLSLFRGLCAAVATIFLLVLLSAQFPAEDAAREEERIFNADNASTFGEDPQPQSFVKLQRLGRDERGEFALLNIDGAERLARSGDSLNPCVKLSSILSDAVLIDNCGAYALLAADLPGANVGVPLRGAQDGGGAMVSPNIVDLRQDRAVRKLLGDYRERLFKRPLSLRGVVNVDVKIDPVGERRYYLSPGKDPALFTLLPLRAGDRVIAVNGFNLAGSEALSDIYAALGDLNQLALTVARGEQCWVLLLKF